MDSLFETEKDEKKDYQKPKFNNKAKVANFVKSKKGEILEIVVELNGNGQRVKYNEKIHKDLKIGDDINI